MTGKEWADLWSSVKDGGALNKNGGVGSADLCGNGLSGSWGDSKEGLLWGTVPPPPLHHHHLGVGAPSPLLSANGNHSEQGEYFSHTKSIKYIFKRLVILIAWIFYSFK